MTETEKAAPAAKVRKSFNKSDIDAQGNVTIYDHGPKEPVASDPPDDEAFKAEVLAANAWHKEHGDGPIAVRMNVTDATHALQVDPERFSIEPADVDEGDVAAEVEAIQERRAAAEKASAEHAAAAQLAEDRKVAIATVRARKAAADAAKNKPGQ